MDNQTVRSVCVIGPDKKIKLVISYPMSTGRNVDEVLRAIDSMQLTARHKVATPMPRVSFPGGWTAAKPYLRYVPQPRG